MRVRLLFAVVAVLTAMTTACSRGEETSLPRPSKPFCDAAHRYDVRVEKLAPIDEQIRIVRKMADNAPKDIARDTNTFLDALERRRDGDKSVVDNPKIQKAVESVNRRAVNGCKLYQNDAGSGI
jgi:hypothetical protein